MTLPFSPATATLGSLPLWPLFALIPLAGLACFAWIIRRRLEPLLRAAPDPRRDRVGVRLLLVLKIWLAQWRHPRYLLAGVLHIVLFLGFLVLGARSLQMVFLGIWPGFALPGLGAGYAAVKDVAATLTLAAVLVLAVRRAAFMPERYRVPPGLGKDHTPEALAILGLIATLLLSEGLFEGSLLAAGTERGIPLTLPWAFAGLLGGTAAGTLAGIHTAAYAVHDVAFFAFLCILPLGKHFHVITSLFNVFFMRVETGNVKPVRHGVPDAQLDEVKSFGVKTLEDFTWKHILDFYSCADCGRCSDRCPANAVGRPLSPRFISIKGRDHAFERFPLLGGATAPAPLIGGIYSEAEIWSCTTCGACEEECPLGIEYIDKIVDLRRGLVDDGLVPQGVQKPLSALEKRGNPWGKLERKRGEWAAQAGVPVKSAEKGETAPLLYFADSMTSYDDRSQRIAQATARILHRAGEDFAILGKEERDSGHDVRRFGEEMLFQSLRDQNVEAIGASGAGAIVVSDPHALNALRHDYPGVPEVRHISELIAEGIGRGALKPSPAKDQRTYTLHDPCYLGRHNGVYDAPRQAMDGIPGLKRVEMEGNCRDRSFCCGGGGLMLFMEHEEKERMGARRVEMARAAGADVIVTACPYCLTNIEDAIKVAGLEGKMEAIDLCELVDAHLDN
ncbi:MAG TPA: (Fe-S)-binding protein [Holophaga sp.]|nr:(Fe-S)-binding protein [Holophaga sp.]